MFRFKKTIVLITALFLMLPLLVFASSYKVSQKDVLVAENETVSGNLYVASGEMYIKGTVKGDVVAATGKLSIDGTVNGDVSAVSGQIDTSGNINGDLRVAGGQIRISGKIDGDLLVGGGDVSLLSGGYVKGDVIMAGGSINLDGKVAGGVRAATGNIFIRGWVDGDIVVNSGIVTVSQGAVINGNLAIKSTKNADIDPGAQIKGTITQHLVQPKAVSPGAKIASIIYGFFAYLILGLFIYWLFSKPFRKVSETIFEEPGKAFLYGLAAFFLVPVIIIFLFFTLIGIPIAVLLLLTYITTVVLSKLFVALAAGKYLFNRFGNSKKVSDYAAITVGLLLYVILANIPVVSWVINFGVWFLGLGSIFLSLRKAHQP